LRAEHSALRNGRLVDLSYDKDEYVFARQDSNECVIVAFNRAEASVQVEVNPASLGLKQTVITSLLGAGTATRGSDAKTILTIPPKTAVAFKAASL
jgi:hypothetical protein